MSVTRTLGALALATVFLGACEPLSQADRPLINTGQGQEQLLRQNQLRGVQTGANPGVQNPVATGTGVGGIIRESGPGTGSTAAGATGLNTDGTIIRPGVGAPPTR